MKSELRMVALEVTRSCNLACVHCRASSVYGPYLNELSTKECLDLIDEIVSFANPVIILTGGEPLLREDIFGIAQYGTDQGLRMVMATNGTLLDSHKALEAKQAGIQRISISLDGAGAETHDAFRQVEGAFDGALRGIEAAKLVGLEFQINSTITKVNIAELPALLDLAVNLGAAAHHIFLLVPTGRGKEMEDQEIPAEEYERTLNWFYDQTKRVNIQLKATCAPHYYRIMRQRAKEEGRTVDFETFGLDAVTRGCLGGISFCFVSHEGQLSPCGYLELDCGNIRTEGFRNAWENSPIFNELRDLSKYKGKCGDCEYKGVCGGCRARAYAKTGDYLEEEPYCVYNL